MSSSPQPCEDDRFEKNILELLKWPNSTQQVTADRAQGTSFKQLDKRSQTRRSSIIFALKHRRTHQRQRRAVPQLATSPNILANPALHTPVLAPLVYELAATSASLSPVPIVGWIIDPIVHRISDAPTCARGCK
ncbi:hypothetical protein FB451DRAFT_1570489 [Mycena latifolia]|nr:hypothetical protein FB451DRAFT_1570489 [Mycena latifolia]